MTWQAIIKRVAQKLGGTYGNSQYDSLIPDAVDAAYNRVCIEAKANFQNRTEIAAPSPAARTVNLSTYANWSGSYSNGTPANTIKVVPGILASPVWNPANGDEYKLVKSTSLDTVNSYSDTDLTEYFIEWPNIILSGNYDSNNGTLYVPLAFVGVPRTDANQSTNTPHFNDEVQVLAENAVISLAQAEVSDALDETRALRLYKKAELELEKLQTEVERVTTKQLLDYGGIDKYPTTSSRFRDGYRWS